MKKLYRYRENFGRMGTLVRIFLATDDEISDTLYKDIYFGEVLGKHSEIIGVLNEQTLELLTDDQEFIEKSLKIGLIPIGDNPIETYRERKEEYE
jgi:hypothetical protein